jgi:hypothetical protein
MDVEYGWMNYFNIFTGPFIFYKECHEFNYLPLILLEYHIVPSMTSIAKHSLSKLSLGSGFV